MKLFVFTALLSCTWFTLSMAMERENIDFEYIAELAKQLANEPEAATAEAESEVPQALRDLSYDDLRNIRFKPSSALWLDEDSAFQVQFFHPGFLFTETVQIYEFSDNYSQKIPFLSDFFDYQDV